MAEKIQSIRGMNDILPSQIPYWHFLEAKCREITNLYGYQEIRFPIVEMTALFKRSIGEVTDIVEKEMYTFSDRNGDSLTLRPEGTAGCVRAGIEHSLFYHQFPRLWYIGPMYRHERPQQGRYRQFYQLGIEAYGINHPAIDAEIILMSWRLWQLLGLTNDVQLQLNSLGNATSRARYRDALISYFQQYENQLDEDCRRRLLINPLRILDSKNPALQTLIQNAPVLLDYLDETAKEHFSTLRQLLDKAKVPYQINPRIVRGLDYYCLTVFEWVTNKLGAQSAICAGGRYDHLVEQLGGPSTPAVGFAAGLERIILLLQQTSALEDKPDIYFVLVGEKTIETGLLIAEELRSRVTHLKVRLDFAGGSLKNQLKRADKSGSRFAIIIGENELLQNQLTLKNLRETTPQKTVTVEQLILLMEGIKNG